MDEKIRVLLIDDEPETVNLVKSYLEMFDMEVSFAYTGMEGMMLLPKEKPTVLVLDLMLPDADGYQLCRLIRHQSATKDLPIIVLSARSTQLDEDRGYGMGATLYLRKPVDLTKLVEEIKRVAASGHVSNSEIEQKFDSSHLPKPKPGRDQTVNIPGMYIPRDKDPRKTKPK
jgi:DNA-binding response OmpR family regulator